MVEQAGALGYFGDARRAAVGTELLERVTASGSLVIRKLGATRAGELAIHRFLSAPSVSCREMLATLAIGCATLRFLVSVSSGTRKSMIRSCRSTVPGQREDRTRPCPVCRSISTNNRR